MGPESSLRSAYHWLCILLFLNFFFIEEELIYTVVLVSGVQRDPVIYIYKCIIFIYINV